LPKDKILIIDDERDFVDTIADWLLSRGFDVIRAFDGKEGLDKAHSHGPDLILLDVAMPQMNGYDVCRHLKLDENFKNIPIVMLTAKFQPNDVRFGQDMGADLYLTKPPELETLLHDIKAILRLKKTKSNQKKSAAT
jgi:two-component system alkaline phosphatase synthesis response regulator PhoP